jgi:hypothetical protein
MDASCLVYHVAQVKGAELLSVEERIGYKDRHWSVCTTGALDLQLTDLARPQLCVVLPWMSHYIS